MTDRPSLASLLDGWNGYQESLVHAITPLDHAQLAWRPAPDLRSVGELARHVALGRLSWFLRMGPPGSADLANQVEHWEVDEDDNRQILEQSIDITGQASELVGWLESSWKMIDLTLNSWDTADLARTYRHTWNGQVYIVSYQWTIWRILAHDLHHGGELSLMLGMQGIEAFELGVLGGHIILPPLAGP
jgi:uncharacterized damage-inducible protein DinB